MKVYHFNMRNQGENKNMNEYITELIKSAKNMVILETG